MENALGEVGQGQILIMIKTRADLQVVLDNIIQYAIYNYTILALKIEVEQNIQKR